MPVYDVSYEPVGISHGEPECLMAMTTTRNDDPTDKVWRYKTDDDYEYETEVKSDNIKQAMDIGWDRITKVIENG